MNTTSSRSKTAGSISRLLYTSLLVCGLGMANSPALAAVTVDQAPLIVQASLPPNITLMLDDSGSMAWDVMPDWDYLSSQGADALVNSDVNGVYYNPTVTYKPPFKADGTRYDAASFGNALVNGFDSGSKRVDISSYDGSSDTSRSSKSSSDIVYSILKSNGSSYTASGCGSYDGASSAYPGYCYDDKDNGSSSFKYNGNYYYYRCKASADTYNSSTGKCSPNIGFFTYTKRNSAGTYTRYYIAKNTGDCKTGGFAASVCSESDTDRQNVANWFSYYHTRMLMAKSGVMNSFIDINTDFRVGFGSIGGSNTSGLGDDYYAFTTKSSSGSYDTGLAKVKPLSFTASGSTQRQKLWDWLVGTYPKSNTPLRGALDYVGQYYQTDQPWTTMSTDPDPTINANKELACRQSYTILTTDGFWNGSTPDNIGDQDDTAGATITGVNAQKPYTYTPALPYADTVTTKQQTNKNTQTFYDLTSNQCTQKYNSTAGSANKSYTAATRRNPSVCTFDVPTIVTVPDGGNSDTLADVAMKYWKTDLRTATNEVPVSKEDPAFWQHMTTFTLGLGFAPSGIQPGGTSIQGIFDWANGGTEISDFSWPTPQKDSINNIADLAHAAVNGHGGFYSATSPDSFTNGLKDALKRASERVGTGASLAANSTQLKTGTYAYQANYFTAQWNGDLKALKVDSTTGEIASDTTWTAASNLTSATAATRNIWTYNSDTKTYVAFKNAAATTTPPAAAAPPALSTTQLGALASTAAGQMDMVDYLRGDSSKVTANGYRSRVSPLGDIVDSQPVYVGSPDPDQFTGQSNLTGLSSFASYANTNSSRAGLIYVAANDGMLHAFYADGVAATSTAAAIPAGSEAYAYLPGAVIKDAGLANLANPEYGSDTLPHQYFNDGELTVADAYFSEGSADVAWHTVLVGTTGRGTARAIYALDVTDPANIKFLWERSAADGLTNSGSIGQMTGKPVIAQTANGTWSVLMGNGYNSTDGKAALLQFALADGTLTVHATDATAGNGLAAPAVWIDPAGNGVSTDAYAGDAAGNVWSFPLQAADGTATPSSAGTKLYTAKKGTVAQPITAGMLAGKDAQTGNLWIFFGTGKYLASSDLADTSTQTWYGLIVKTTDSTNHPVVASTMTRADLAQRSITAETEGKAAVPADDSTTPPTAAVPAVLPARTVTTTAQATSLTGKSGWYMDLLAPTASAPDSDGKVTYTPNATQEGERMVTSNQFQGNLLLATTRIPQATDACNPSGRGWIMVIDPFTGTNPQADFFDTNGDGVIDSKDGINGTPAAGVGFSSLPNNPIFVGGNMLTSFDNGSTSSLKTSGSGGGFQRVSWRELIAQ